MLPPDGAPRAQDTGPAPMPAMGQGAGGEAGLEDRGQGQQVGKEGAATAPGLSWALFPSSDTARILHQSDTMSENTFKLLQGVEEDMTNVWVVRGHQGQGNTRNTKV